MNEICPLVFCRTKPGISIWVQLHMQLTSESKPSQKTPLLPVRHINNTLHKHLQPEEAPTILFVCCLNSHLIHLFMFLFLFLFSFSQSFSALITFLTLNTFLMFLCVYECDWQHGFAETESSAWECVGVCVQGGIVKVYGGSWQNPADVLNPLQITWFTHEGGIWWRVLRWIPEALLQFLELCKHPQWEGSTLLYWSNSSAFDLDLPSHQRWDLRA